jgi:hypothetical protein
MLELNSRLFMVMLGLFFTCAGAAGIRGKYKRWYWSSKRTVFAYIPVGVLFFLVALGQGLTGALLPKILWGAEVLVFAIALWWLIQPPAWLQPDWIRQIEEHPKAVYDVMQQQVKAGTKWQTSVQDPQSLEKWIQSVEKGLQRKRKGR